MYKPAMWKLILTGKYCFYLGEGVRGAGVGEAPDFLNDSDSFVVI